MSYCTFKYSKNGAQLIQSSQSFLLTFPLNCSSEFQHSFLYMIGSSWVFHFTNFLYLFLIHNIFMILIFAHVLFIFNSNIILNVFFLEGTFPFIILRKAIIAFKIQIFAEFFLHMYTVIPNISCQHFMR